MNSSQLNELFSTTLRSPTPSEEQFEQLAIAVVEGHSSGDPAFRRHVQNRLKQIGKRSGREFPAGDLDVLTARLLIADEIGYESWDKLVDAFANLTDDSGPLLFRYAIAAMERGDFSALESMVGGSGRFNDQIEEWYENGYFKDEPETLTEVFTASCMLGYDQTAAYLLDKGVDPLAGTRTGLNGFHYAASSGRLNVIKLLIERKVPMESENMYGATVLGQALWSAVNESSPDHAAIIEALIDARGEVEQGTLSWWNEQSVPSAETKNRVASILRKHGNS